MGNVNNCLSNAFEFDEITVKPQQNLVTDKSLRGAKSKDLQSRYYLFNKEKLEIIDEEDNPESNIFIDKKPKNLTQRSIVNTIKEECSLIATPKDIKILENKFNSKFNNNLNSNYNIDNKINFNLTNSDKNNNVNNSNINNNQNIMMLDNVYFNSTRKSNPIQTNNDMVRYNKDNNSIINSIDRLNKNEFKEGAVNSSNNNLESNKMMNSLEESSNLIILEYNRPETPKNNNDINLNDINGYNNNDGYFQNRNSKIYNNIDNNENNNSMNDMNERNKNELMSYDNKIGNFNNLMRKINSNYSVEESANIKESNKDDLYPKGNVNLVNNNKCSVNTVKNEFTDAIKNLKNNNAPYIKPKLNSNYNDKGPIDNEMNNYTYINKRKIVQKENKENPNEPADNYIYSSSRNKEGNKPNSFQINNKNSSDGQNNNNNFNLNNLVILNNRYDKIISKDKYKTANYNNKKINQSDPIKFISNSRKLNSEPNQNLIKTQSQFTDKHQEIPQVINKPIYYNKTNINIDNTKIYDSPILDIDRRHTEANIINNINNGIISPIHIQSKSQDLLESKDEAIINNNKNNINNIENNMSPDERILYQSPISDNIEEENLKVANDDILRRSASFGEDENGNNNNNIEQEINSPIEQNMQEGQSGVNLEYEIGQKYNDSDPNGQNIIKQPISKNNYNSLIIQQKEQMKMNPEYEQTQEAHDEQRVINELQKQVIAQSDAPKDKDSESDIEPKMHEQEPLTSEVKRYFQKKLLPMNIDSVTFQKKEFIKDNNNDNDTNLYKNEINKINSKINYNSNENEEKEDYENENNFNSEKNNSQGDQFFSIPLTKSKFPNEDNQFIINKQSYNNNDNKDENYGNNNNIHNINNNVDENENENIINNNENENNYINNHYNDDENKNNLNNKYNNNAYFEELECKEFEDFSPDNWKRFYPKDERFFIFPQKDIIPNKLISNNTDSIDEEIYQGDINKKGEKHGFGKYISPMMKRIGMWRNDKFTGWGREIRENDDIYEGRFVDGKLNGKGIYKNKKSKTTYVGDFLNSKFNGKGEIYTMNYHYHGDFINNKMNGNGKIEIYNQGEYEGTFKDDQFDGNGMLKWKDGKYYIGEVSKGQMNGYGEEKFPDGTICKGNFVNGKMQGHGKVITPEGQVIEGEFFDGKLKNRKK